MAVKENQTVRIVPSRLMSFPSDVSRFLDRRKGGGRRLSYILAPPCPKCGYGGYPRARTTKGAIWFT